MVNSIKRSQQFSIHYSYNNWLCCITSSSSQIVNKLVSSRHNHSIYKDCHDFTTSTTTVHWASWKYSIPIMYRIGNCWFHNTNFHYISMCITHGIRYQVYMKFLICLMYVCTFPLWDGYFQLLGMLQ